MIREHDLDIYGQRLLHAATRKDLKKLRTRFPGRLDGVRHDIYGSVTTLNDPDAGGRVVIYISKANNRNPAVLVNTIAHEAYHAAGLILDNIEQRYDGNTEAMAWLVGWLTEWLWIGHQKAWEVP